MLRLLTDDEVIAKYGDYRPHVSEDGLVKPIWPQTILEVFQLPKPLPLSFGGIATKISCHKTVKTELENLMYRLVKLPEVWESINDYGGCYNFRRVRMRPQYVSRHSWGIAVDLDVKDSDKGNNPHPLLIQGFYDIGWYWGGWFRTPDRMHFEKATNL
jgi:hypothetical protein